MQHIACCGAQHTPSASLALLKQSSQNFCQVAILRLSDNKFLKNSGANSHNALSAYIYAAYAFPINLDRLWRLDIIRQPW